MARWALPAAAVAAKSATVADLADDPGLAKLEAGFARWQALHDQSEALEKLRDAASDQAKARLSEYREPEPEPPERAGWIGHLPAVVVDMANNPNSPVSIPQELLDE